MASYFCTPDLEVVHAIAGPVSKERFLQEARWTVETWSAVRKAAGSDRDLLVAGIRKAHEAKGTESCSSAARVYQLLGGQPTPGVYHGCWTPTAPLQANPAVTTLEWRPGAAVTQEGALRSGRECQPALLKATRLQDCDVGTTMTTARAQLLVTLGMGSRDLHPLLAGKGLPKLDDVYAHVFQDVLGERLSNDPVRMQEMMAVRTVRQVLQVTEPDAALRKEVEDLRRQVAELKAKLETKSKVY